MKNLFEENYFKNMKFKTESNFIKKFPTSPIIKARFISKILYDIENENFAMTDGKTLISIKMKEIEKKDFGNERGFLNWEGNFEKSDTPFPPYLKIFDLGSKDIISDVFIDLLKIEKEINEEIKRLKELDKLFRGKYNTRNFLRMIENDEPIFIQFEIIDKIMKVIMRVPEELEVLQADKKAEYKDLFNYRDWFKYISNGNNSIFNARLLLRLIHSIKTLRPSQLKVKWDIQNLYKIEEVFHLKNNYIQMAIMPMDLK